VAAGVLGFMLSSSDSFVYEPRSVKHSLSYLTGLPTWYTGRAFAKSKQRGYLNNSIRLTKKPGESILRRALSVVIINKD
jgi:hypothetical protein